MEMDKPHFLSEATETAFCNLKDKDPLFSKKTKQPNTPYLTIGITFDPPWFSPGQSL
jgi:hypothetical protein